MHSWRHLSSLPCDLEVWSGLAFPWLHLPFLVVPNPPLCSPFPSNTNAHVPLYLLRVYLPPLHRAVLPTWPAVCLCSCRPSLRSASFSAHTPPFLSLPVLLPPTSPFTFSPFFFSFMLLFFYVQQPPKMRSYLYLEKYPWTSKQKDPQSFSSFPNWDPFLHKLQFPATLRCPTAFP